MLVHGPTVLRDRIKRGFCLGLWAGWLVGVFFLCLVGCFLGGLGGRGYREGGGVCRTITNSK